MPHPFVLVYLHAREVVADAGEMMMRAEILEVEIHADIAVVEEEEVEEILVVVIVGREAHLVGMRIRMELVMMTMVVVVMASVVEDKHAVHLTVVAVDVIVRIAE